MVIFEKGDIAENLGFRDRIRQVLMASEATENEAIH